MVILNEGEKIITEIEPCTTFIARDSTFIETDLKLVITEVGIRFLEKTGKENMTITYAIIDDVYIVEEEPYKTGFLSKKKYIPRRLCLVIPMKKQGIVNQRTHTNTDWEGEYAGNTVENVYGEVKMKGEISVIFPDNPDALDYLEEVVKKLIPLHNKMIKTNQAFDDENITKKEYNKEWDKLEKEIAKIKPFKSK